MQCVWAKPCWRLGPMPHLNPRSPALESTDAESEPYFWIAFTAGAATVGWLGAAAGGVTVGMTLTVSCTLILGCVGTSVSNVMVPVTVAVGTSVSFAKSWYRLPFSSGLTSVWIP